MRLTAQRLNRATLARQLLLRREPLGVVDAVRRVVALQAQEPPSPYIALWNRLAGFEAIGLDAAFSDHSVVKAPLMRITLHAVAAEDYPAFHEAMQGTLRAARLNDRRFRSTGLSVAEAESLMRQLIEFAAVPRTKDEIEAMLADRLGGPPDRGVFWALRTVAPLLHAPTGGPWSFERRISYFAAPADTPVTDRAEAVRRLIRRYLEGFGPATANDIGQFALLRQSTIRPALEAIADGLVTYEGPDGHELLDVPGAPLPEEEVEPPPRLMGMWESILLAYADRSRVIPDEYRQMVIRRNGDVLPTLLVDGYICGVWRPVDGGIEAKAFRPLRNEAWDGLATEAQGLASLLAGRDPAAYSRYARWWSDLPAAQARALPE